MEDWIIQNKEWFLSGAGIFVIGGVFSFLSVLFTLWFKSRSEKKKIKRLLLSEKLVKFELPDAEGEIDNSALLVSYRGNEYKHLCHYTISITNAGIGAIETQKLLFSFPNNTSILEFFENASNSSINLRSEKIEKTNDILYSVDRLEPGEKISISMLANSEDSDSIECKPRGVDNIDYIWGKTSSTSDIEVLVVLLAAFIFVDIVPLIGNVLQGLVILASAPVLVRITESLISQRRSAGNVVNISGGFNVADEAMVNVNQSDGTAPNKAFHRTSR